MSKKGDYVITNVRPYNLEGYQGNQCKEPAVIENCEIHIWNVEKKSGLLYLYN